MLSAKWITTKLGVEIGHRARKNLIKIGVDPDKRVDPGVFFLYHCKMGMYWTFSPNFTKTKPWLKISGIFKRSVFGI